MNKEINIFQQNCPIPLREVEELSHIILMNLLPALVEGDIETFGSSINAIQKLGFKRREVDLQPVSKELMQALRDGGAYGAGMSSFGPTVYALGEGVEDLTKIARDFLGEKGQVFITKSRNEGARIDCRSI